MEVRASDAEREATTDRLRTAAAEGRLTLDELSDRVEATAAARTRAQLAELVADLPAPGGRLAAPVGGAVAAHAPTRNSALFGDLVRRGPWTLPAESHWSTLLGDVELDLREASVAAAEVEVHATTLFGDIVLTVPEGVVVEVRARTTLGDVRQEAGAVASPDAPRIVLTGRTTFGDVRVRPEPRRSRFVQRFLGSG